MTVLEEEIAAEKMDPNHRRQSELDVTISEMFVDGADQGQVGQGRAVVVGNSHFR
jgi:hypothetical protein